jgi:hypothetical protein
MIAERPTALNRITRIGVKQHKAAMIAPMIPVLSACLEPVELGWVGVENFLDRAGGDLWVFTEHPQRFDLC